MSSAAHGIESPFYIQNLNTYRFGAKVVSTERSFLCLPERTNAVLLAFFIKKSVPSGRKVENSEIGYTKTALIESGLFCIYLKIE